MVVLVAFAEPLLLHELIGRIAKVQWNRQVSRLVDELHGIVDGGVGRIAFRACGQINHTLAQRNPPLGHANTLYRREGLIGHDQGRGIGQSNVLSG